MYNVELITPFNTDNINTRVQKQINSYIKDYGYSYSGILKALIYFFEIKENSIENDQKYSQFYL